MIDPDGSYHYIFTSGSLPFGSGTRTDTLQISSGSLPFNTDGTWEFYLSDQMFNNVDIDEVYVEVQVTSSKMPATYSEETWHNADAYRGGIDLSGNQEHVYPDNGATIVANTGSGGSNAFSLDGVNDIWENPDGNAAFDTVGTCSWSAWVNLAVGRLGGMIFCNHGYYKGNWQLRMFSKKISLLLKHYDPVLVTSDDGMETTTTTTISNATWHHIAVVFDGSQSAADRIKIWVDNSQQSTTLQEWNNGVTAIPLGNPFAGRKAPYSIGALRQVSLSGTPSTTLHYAFGGMIDDCRTWPGYALTSDDITWLYSGRGVAGGPPSFKPYFASTNKTIGFNS